MNIEIEIIRPSGSSSVVSTTVAQALTTMPRLIRKEIDEGSEIRVRKPAPSPVPVYKAPPPLPPIESRPAHEIAAETRAFMAALRR